MATSTILGPDGRPIVLGEATAEPQTARLTYLQRELQSHPTRGLTPSKLAQIPDAQTGEPVVFASGELVDMRGARMWWSDEFSYKGYYRSNVT